ncbi:hypothetical protein D3C75_897370 [compost metagenome]
MRHQGSRQRIRLFIGKIAEIQLPYRFPVAQPGRMDIIHIQLAVAQMGQHLPPHKRVHGFDSAEAVIPDQIGVINFGEHPREPPAAGCRPSAQLLLSFAGQERSDSQPFPADNGEIGHGDFHVGVIPVFRRTDHLALLHSHINPQAVVLERPLPQGRLQHLLRGKHLLHQAVHSRKIWIMNRCDPDIFHV